MLVSHDVSWLSAERLWYFVCADLCTGFLRSPCLRNYRIVKLIRYWWNFLTRQEKEVSFLKKKRACYPYMSVLMWAHRGTSIFLFCFLFSKGIVEFVARLFLKWISTNIRYLVASMVDVMAATSVLQQRANEIRNHSVNWQSYLQ